MSWGLGPDPFGATWPDGTSLYAGGLWCGGPVAGQPDFGCIGAAEVRIDGTTLVCTGPDGSVLTYSCG